jgi:hypothetical protein
MTLAADRDCSGLQFCVEDVTTGIYPNGFGRMGDGRSFAFYTERQELVVEIYRPRLSDPVPHDEDVVAIARRSVKGIDVTDERSVIAAVRDAVANAQPVTRNGAKPAR